MKLAHFRKKKKEYLKAIVDELETNSKIINIRDLYRGIIHFTLLITNMYSNIPTNELITIINKFCEANNIENRLKQDILKILKTIIDQNFFRFQDNMYIQNEGLVMGAPTSSVFF
jgi:hypothetical protein